VRSFGVTAYACHPLLAGGQVVGTLSFGTKSRLTFAEDELFLMKTVADQVAIAMERMRLIHAERERAAELEKRVAERTREVQETYDRLILEARKREQLEDQLRQSQKMEAIGTLAGGIAHDFNNILAAIIGFSEMIEEDLPEGSPSAPHIERVLSASKRGRDLVRQILAFSRRTEHARFPVSVGSLMRETIQFLRASFPSTIEIVLDATAVSDLILATPVEVQQVLVNVATNASLAMADKGGILHISISEIEIEPGSLSLEADMVPGAYVEILIKDTGTGMEPEVMDRIFEPFYTTRGPGKGTGMGLAVVYGIVKSLHGAVTVESEPGVGSTFRIVLPRAGDCEHTETDAPEQSPGQGGRVLFVDDEEALAEWGQAALERLGYDVTAVTGSAEALEAFSLDPSLFDIVITDQTMPGMTGLDLAREILGIRRDIPVILCTGHSDAVTQEILGETGIKELLMKPLVRQELADTISRVLADGRDE
jgi:signal transduction histidine kinase/ActR/RegA family two-component response regulator